MYWWNWSICHFANTAQIHWRNSNKVVFSGLRDRMLIKGIKCSPFQKAFESAKIALSIMLWQGKWIPFLQSADKCYSVYSQGESFRRNHLFCLVFLHWKWNNVIQKEEKKLLVNFMFVYFSFASTVIYSSFHLKMWAVCITRKFGYSYNLLFINKLFPVLILYFS